MESGEKCVCSWADLFNAFGDRQKQIERGQRLTFKASKRVGGLVFYTFKETDGLWYQSEAFTPIRRLN